MKIIKEWYVEAPWGKIALISWGNRKGEKVLLVHGRQDSAATFLPLLELLPDDLHYVALDLPGHGESDPFPIGLALSRFHFVSPVKIVVQHLKWKSFTYMSHSMGGEIGLFLNAACPNLINKFIHLDVGLALYNITQIPFTTYYLAYENYYDNYGNFNTDDRVYTKLRAVQSVMGARGVSRPLAELILSRNLRRLDPAAPADPDDPAAPAARADPADPDDDEHMQYRLSWDKRLKNLISLNIPYEQMLYLFTTNIPPTLFIAATDSVNKYQNLSADRLIQEMQKRVNHFELVIVEGSHDVHLTNPEKIADDVTAFLLGSVKSKL